MHSSNLWAILKYIQAIIDAKILYTLIDNNHNIQNRISMLSLDIHTIQSMNINDQSL